MFETNPFTRRKQRSEYAARAIFALMTSLMVLPLLVIVAAIVVFGLSLERLGLLITVPLLIVISSLAGGEFGWKGVAANAAVLTFGAWGIFVWGLKLTLPLWPRMFQ